VKYAERHHDYNEEKREIEVRQALKDFEKQIIEQLVEGYDEKEKRFKEVI
jgi:lipase chaperone LimK